MHIRSLALITICGLTFTCKLPITSTSESPVHPMCGCELMPVAYFEKEHYNLAWTYMQNGWRIDGRGYIDTFSYSISDSMWKVNDDSLITRYEMNQMMSLSHSSNRQVDITKIDSMVALIPEAARGTIADSSSRCADFGATTYSAFLYDTISQGYKKVKLYQAGDIAFRNTSPAAKKLTDWLMSIDSTTEEAFPCRPE